MRQTLNQTLLDAVTPVAVTSSTDATPIVVTATSHGLSVGDRVMIFGHTTNVAANGIFKVSVVGSANAFTIVDEFTGASVAGSGAGAGSSGICLKAPVIPLVQDFRTIVLEVITAGTATTTLKVAGSLGAAQSDSTTPRWGFPNIGATVTKTNPYSFLQLVNLDDSSTVNGSTGIVVAGTDINKLYEVNTNLMKWITIFPVTWSAGAITVRLVSGTNL